MWFHKDSGIGIVFGSHRERGLEVIWFDVRRSGSSEVRRFGGQEVLGVHLLSSLLSPLFSSFLLLSPCSLPLCSALIPFFYPPLLSSSILLPCSAPLSCSALLHWPLCGCSFMSPGRAPSLPCQQAGGRGGDTCRREEGETVGGTQTEGEGGPETLGMLLDGSLRGETMCSAVLCVLFGHLRTC